MNCFKILMLFFFVLIGCTQLTFAHGDLHERIVEVTDEIKMKPDSSFLYFKRGKLFFQHKDFEKAIQDMSTANDLGFHDLQCDLIFAKCNQELLEYDKAIQYLDKIDKERPNHVIALKTRAEILFQQNEFEMSAINYEKVIEHSIKTIPENYLAAHQSWLGLNTKAADKKAIEILEKGMTDLGSIFTLLQAQQNLYVAKGDFKNALLIQEKIIKSANRKETAYYKAAELCRAANDKRSMGKYLEQSLNAINILPARKQQTKAMVNLKKKVEAELIDINHLGISKQVKTN